MSVVVVVVVLPDAIDEDEYLSKFAYLYYRLG